MTPRQKSKPIMFSGPMVRAILDGTKTQTRRVTARLRGAPPTAGDRLWVRETWRLVYDPATCSEGALEIDYRADGKERIMDRIGKGQWRPSIFMPRWASRIMLEVVRTRTEQLQDITEEDAIDEGCSRAGCSRAAFRDLWDSINGRRFAWESNPQVLVIEFKKTTECYD